MQRLTIRLTKADYAAGERHISESVRSQAPFYSAVYLLILVIVILVALGFGGVFSLTSKVKSQYYWNVVMNGFFLAAAVVLYFVMAYFAKWSVASVVFKNGSKLLAPFEFSPEQAGIVITSVNGRSETRWSAIERMGIHGPHLYLFSLPHTALIVPESAFSSRAEFESYARELHALWSGSAA